MLARRRPRRPYEPQPAVVVTLGEEQLRLHLLPELDEPRRPHPGSRGLQGRARLGEVATYDEGRDAVDLGEGARDRAAAGGRPREAFHVGQPPPVVEGRLERDVQWEHPVEVLVVPFGRRVVTGHDLEDVPHGVGPP